LQDGFFMEGNEGHLTGTRREGGSGYTALVNGKIYTAGGGGLEEVSERSE